MKIAFYAPFVPASAPRASGDRTQARAAIAVLEGQGHRIQVVSEFRSKLFWLDVQRVAALPSEIWRAHAELRAFGADAWLTFVCDTKTPDVLGPLFTAWLRIPYVIYDSPWRNYGRLRRSEGRLRHLWSTLPGHLMSSAALFAADHVVVNKAIDYDRHSRSARLARKLSLLSPGVALDKFAPDPRSREETRRQLGIAPREPVVLSVSRFSAPASRKAESVGFLIDCVAELRQRACDARLVIVGDGSARRELEERAERLGGATTFVGAVEHEELAAYYNAADVFAFPGLREPIGQVYLEAQACGLPVVAFANGGIPELVRAGITGFLVEQLDREAFVDSLKRLLDGEGLRRSMGAAAREHVERRHDAEDWGRTLAALLEG